MSQDSNKTLESKFSLQRLFVKNVSFKSHLDDKSFGDDLTPKVYLDFNSSNVELNEGVYEVILTVSITAKNSENNIFLIELQQSGIFLCQGFPHERKNYMLGVLAPDILFPYVREIVDTLVIKASFPIFTLSPINFDKLYRQELSFFNNS